jgi:hypothetical protein
MSRALPGALCAAAALAALLVLGSATAAEPQTAARDFSGVWLPDGKHSERLPRQWPLTPAAQAAADAYQALHGPIDPTVDDANASCIPEPFPYAMRLIAQYPFEIVMTARQVTLLFEIYGGVRRIHLDGRRPPPELLPTTMGFSTGHWDGDTLVVETSHVKTEGAGPFTGSPPRSSARRFIERISLGKDTNGKKQLRDEITIHDPTVLSKPVQLTMLYKWSPDIEVGEYLCQQDIWDQHIQGHPSSVPWRH